MLSQAQVGMKGRESVGQLYTRDLTAQTVLIELATRLPPRRRLRKRMSSSREDCIGLWHTHPETHPKPSGEDRQLARNYAAAASQQVQGVVFVIV